MKNEAPFILEWIAHHRAIGFDHFLVFTNDCTDGTVELLDALAERGYVTRMDNPYEEMGSGYNPQKGALKFAEGLDLVRDADWILVSDVDEFVNIHTGQGHLDDLISTAPNADIFSMQWRLFGNAFQSDFNDKLITETHTHCAPKFCPNPIQAWGIKSLFRSDGGKFGGVYNRIGVHRPLRRDKDKFANWIAGSGKEVHVDYADKGWRFGIRDHGYGLVTLNHYAVRNAGSYLVKRERGRVNHVHRDQGLAYWMRMNFNMELDTSLFDKLPQTKKELRRLKRLKGVNDLHKKSVATHSSRIDALKSDPSMQELYRIITSDELNTVSKHLNFVSRKQFEEGPSSLPEELLEKLAKVPNF